jgi:hypothetical protein
MPNHGNVFYRRMIEKERPIVPRRGLGLRDGEKTKIVRIEFGGSRRDDIIMDLGGGTLGISSSNIWWEYHAVYPTQGTQVGFQHFHFRIWAVPLLSRLDSFSSPSAASVPS